MSSPYGSSSPNQNASFDSNYVIENKENIPPGMVFPSRQPDVASQENQKNAQSAAEILSQQQQPLQVKVLGETNKSIPLQLANLPPFVLPTMKKPFSVIQSVSSLTRKRSTDQKLPNPPSFKREHLAADDDKMDAEVDVVGDGLPSPPLSQQSDDTSVVSSQDSVTDSPRVFPTSSQIRLPRTTSSNDEDMDDEFDEENGATTSRKEKSLGLLCQRFLLAMQEETKFSETREVHLETVARKMNVEKRRIYDIVNVMEALDAMSKTNKSYYKWHGLEGLPKLMDELQNEALLEKLPERVHRVEQAMCSFTELSPSSRMKFNAVAALSGGNRPQPFVGSLVALDENLSYLPQNGSQTNENCLKSMSQEKDQSRKSRIEARDRMGRNSLAQLCRRFLMVVLSNPKDRRVSLDVASTVLIKDPETEGFEPPSRSRCRRLYDIANVLVALGLIKKVHYLFGTKKIPLFVYCGPEPDANAKFDVSSCIERILIASNSAPQTPQMKATTAALQQSLTLAKRSHSDANLNEANNANSSQAFGKLPRIKSEFIASSSLMMFAELAAQESVRLKMKEAFEKLSTATSAASICSGKPSSSLPMVRTNSGNILVRPEPHKLASYKISPLTSPNIRATEVKKYSGKVENSTLQVSSIPLVQPIVLPINPTWQTLRARSPAPFSVMRTPSVANSSNNSATFPRHYSNTTLLSQISTPASFSTHSTQGTNTSNTSSTSSGPSYSVSRILGVSNKINTSLNHNNSGPFQVVKKENSFERSTNLSQL